MARIVLYQEIALVVALAAVPSNPGPPSPEVFARPFPVQDQQYVAQALQQYVAPFDFGSLSPEVIVESFVTGETALVPAKSAVVTSPWKQQPLNPEVIVKPFPVGGQQYVALVPARTTGTGNTSVWRQQPVNPEIFAQPFLPADQQFFTGVAEPLNPAAAISWGSGSPEVVQDGVVIEVGQVTPPHGTIISATPPQGWQSKFAEAFVLPVIKKHFSYFSLPFQQYESWVDFWPQWAKPFPVGAQQYSAQTFQPLVTVGPNTPALAWGASFPELAFDTFVFEETALVPATAAGTSNAAIWQQPINPEVFALPFPPWDQQYLAFDPEQVPSPVYKEGWRGYQFDAQIAKPFPAAAQQFQTTVYGKVTTAFREGWRGVQFDYRFSVPVPAATQQYLAYGRGIIPTVPTPHGWEGIQLEARFTARFPVQEQSFQAWPPEFVPVVPVLPGSGKRKNFPSPDVAQPPYSVKPNKPYRPVWDKPRQGEIERPAPPPLPPAALFTPGPPPANVFAPRKAPAPLALPDFKQFAPPNPMAFDSHMRDVQDQVDIMALLKSMGIGTDEG